MFRNHYQGGAVFEVFSGQGKDPVAKWKLFGGRSTIYKEYDKDVKGCVYCLEGSSQTVKMQLPKNAKESLGLLQRFLVLQVNVPQDKDFSIELVITDVGTLKRRLYLSTVHKELSTTVLHAKIPFVGLERQTWSTLCIDLVSFTGELFKDSGFATLDGITLSATCKVRRIFTMKAKVADMLLRVGFTDPIPRSCYFPSDLNHVCQLLNMDMLKKSGLRTAQENSDCPQKTTRPQGLVLKSGSRAAGPPPRLGRISCAASAGAGRSGSCIQNTRRVLRGTDPPVTTEPESITDLTAKLSTSEPDDLLHDGLLTRRPSDNVLGKQGLDKQRICVSKAGGEKQASSADAASDPHNKRNDTDKTSVSKKPSMQEVRQQHGRQTTEVQSSWESHEEPEPQLSLQGEMFTFSSHSPHSPKQRSGPAVEERREMGDDQLRSKSVRRCEALPEDDFFGSESEETTYRKGSRGQKLVD